MKEAFAFLTGGRGRAHAKAATLHPRKKRGDRMADKTVKLKAEVIKVLDHKGYRGESYSDVVLRALKRARWA